MILTHEQTRGIALPQTEGFGLYEMQFLERLRQTNERLQQTVPTAQMRVLSFDRSAHFLFYTDGDITTEDLLSHPATPILAACMEKAAHLVERDTCEGFSRSLQREGLVTNAAYILPISEDNIRGVKETEGFHVIGEIAGENYTALFDGTCPQRGSEEAKKIGFPIGIIILTEERQKAQRIARILYGDFPENSDRRLRGGYY